MKFRWNYLNAFLICAVGFGGLLGYDLYVKPYILSEKIVKIKVASGEVLPKNHEIKPGDIYLDSVQTKDVPTDALRNIDEVQGKILNVGVTNGVILTSSLVDVDELEPKNNEGIYPIPKDAIYAINGSLRSRDKVDIYLIKNPRNNSNNPGGEAETLLSAGEPIFRSITVNYVRTEDNNDVKDTEEGNYTNRYTSTGKVSTPELKLTKEQGETLKPYLEQGMMLWIVRVE